MNEELMKVVAEMRRASTVNGGVSGGPLDSWADRLEALAATSRGTEVPEEVDEYASLIRARKPVQAIKIYRNRHGCSLIEAKDAIESIRSKMLGGGA